MENLDNALITLYMKGFDDELAGIDGIIDTFRLVQKAYNLGKLHALLGDELSHKDLLTKEEIILQIKKD